MRTIIASWPGILACLLTSVTAAGVWATLEWEHSDLLRELGRPGLALVLVAVTLLFMASWPTFSAAIAMKGHWTPERCYWFAGSGFLFVIAVVSLPLLWLNPVAFPNFGFVALVGLVGAIARKIAHPELKFWRPGRERKAITTLPLR